MKTTVRSVTLAVIVALAVVAVAAQPAAAQSNTEPAFVVDVHADGSADVSLRSTFDLTTDDEQDAFSSLMDDEQARQNAKDRFLKRMQAVANDAENATGRAMAVTGARIDLRLTADNETGIVTISVTWDGLAAVDGGSLTVTEPFASGFDPERPFVLRAPDGYSFTSVTPEPDDRTASVLTWEAGTDLTGLSVVMEAEDTPSGAEDTAVGTDGQPGFGWATAGLALVGTIGLLASRVSRRR